MWGYVASQFANESGMLGYDLFNEPSTPTNWTPQEMYHNRPAFTTWISAIRKVDARHVIFFETSDWDSGIYPFYWVEPDDPYQELTLDVHDYYITCQSNAYEGPLAPSGALGVAISASDNWGIPFRWGVRGYANYEVIRKPVTAFDSYGLFRCYWTYFWAWWQGYTFDGAGLPEAGCPRLDRALRQTLLRPRFLARGEDS